MYISSFIMCSTAVEEQRTYHTYSVRIGDTHGIYDITWRNSCARVRERLRNAKFILINEETPLEIMNADCPRNFFKPDVRIEKVLDYLAVGDFNRFFQIAIDSAMSEKLYLAECRETKIRVLEEVEIPICSCAIL